MEVLINNQLHNLEDRASIMSALRSLSAVPSKGIAVAVNQVVVPRSDWENFLLNPTDKIDIITATQGG